MAVSPVGLGCWQFSGGKGIIGGFWQGLEPEVERDIVKTSVDGGINWFDTAEAYGWGRSEEALRSALKSVGVTPNIESTPDPRYVATKWFPFFRFASSMRRTIAARRAKLGEYPIDLYQIHAPASFSRMPVQMAVLAKLIDEGQIRRAGVSNFSASQMEQAYRELKKQGHTLVSNQVRYSLLDRRIERNGVLDTAARLGMTIIAYSPLEQGILTGKFHDDPEIVKRRPGPRKYMKTFKPEGLDRSRPLIELLKRVGSGHGVSAAQVALRWVVQFHGERVVAIPGASSQSQAAQNAGTLSFTLTREELDRIDSASRAL
ncbi:MAG TPA: aldo/keto reductase [Spirochaetia bacterium]|nr:aldo/keto reductase [Spirochaetia bacterium]